MKGAFLPYSEAGRGKACKLPWPRRSDYYADVADFLSPPIMHAAAMDLLTRYYDAFNAGDMAGFLDLLTEDVVHDINQGGRECGRAAFAAFMQRMNRSYRERIVDIVLMANAQGNRAAAEYTVLGSYLATDAGLPPARGQIYRLPGGAFFEIRDGRVARVTNYYNLRDWLAQVGAGG